MKCLQSRHSIYTDIHRRSGGTEVELVPGTSYLEGGGILEGHGLWLHTKLLVIICRSCKVALTSDMLVGHLKNHHGRKVSKEDAEKLRNVCKERAVYARPESVPRPRPFGPPVEGITEPEDGFSCTASGECRYSVRDVATMKRHGRERHGCGLQDNARYRPSKVQSLFRAIAHAFFEVDPTLTSSSKVDVRAYLWGLFLPSVAGNPVVTEAADRDRPPLLKVTLWDQFMPQIRESVEQRKAARSIKAAHTEGEHQGIFMSLAEVVELHRNTVKVALEGHGQSFTLAKVVLNGPGFSPEQYVAQALCTASISLTEGFYSQVEIFSCIAAGKRRLQCALCSDDEGHDSQVPRTPIGVAILLHGGPTQLSRGARCDAESARSGRSH